MDGGFGREQSPRDLETIADLAKLEGLLGQRGYKTSDIEAIAHGNLIEYLTNAWQ